MIIPLKKKESLMAKIEKTVADILYPKNTVQHLLFEPFMEEYYNPMIMPDNMIYIMDWCKDKNIQLKLF